MRSPAVNHLNDFKNAYTIVSRYALDAFLAGPSPTLSFQQAHQILQGKPQAIGWLISNVKRSGITIRKMQFPSGLTEDDVRAVEQGVVVEPVASTQPAFDLIQLTNESVGGNAIRMMTMTQVSKQIQGKEVKAELILKAVVKFAAKLKLDPALLGIRIIPQIPESVLPDKRAFEPTVTPLTNCGKEDYKQTILSLEPKKDQKIIEDFKDVAEKFQLQHDDSALTLATLYNATVIHEHLKKNVETFETA